MIGRWEGICGIRARYLRFLPLFPLLVIACASEDDVYQEAVRINDVSTYNKFSSDYPDGKYASDVQDRVRHIEKCRQISARPADYLTVTFYPADDVRVHATSVTESTFRERGAMSALLMNHLLAEEGRVNEVRVKVVPVVESKADVPLEVRFNAVLYYERNVYDSMYELTPSKGRSSAVQSLTKGVNVRLKAGDRVVGPPIDFGTMKLLEAGKTLVGYMEIKRKIKSIDAEYVSATPPESSGISDVLGAGPVFEPPIMSSRTIDACIRSPQFPEVTGKQCIHSAQKQIADAFCQAAGFKSAIDDFQTRDTGKFQSSHKFIKEPGSDGRLVGRWVQEDTGGAIFTRIACTT